MSTKAKWAYVWSGWATYFAVAEFVAIRSRDHDAPLSAHLRTVLGAKHVSKARRLSGCAVLVGGSVWLIDHLFRGVIDNVG